METTEKSWLGKNIVYLLAVFVTSVWGAITLYLVARALKLVGDGVDLTAVLSVYSTVTAVFSTVLNFYFGSSTGSREKQDKINELTSAKT